MGVPSGSNKQPIDDRVGGHVESADERTRRIRTKNRRHMYLERHPEYFESSDLELADPLLYDRCVRRFLTAAEREADGRSKGFSGILEADLYRSEAKISALADVHNQGDNVEPSVDRPRRHVTYVRGPDGQILPEDPEEIPKSKEEGIRRWRHEMTMRFLRGDDNDFPYEEVDESDALDVFESREEEEKWFDEEEADSIDHQRDKSGETGIQDF